jgi:hypothetical protein
VGTPVQRQAFLDGVLSAMEILIGTDSTETQRKCLDLMTETRSFQNETILLGGFMSHD